MSFLGYGYRRNNLARLAQISQYLTHRDVADISNLLFSFCVYMIKGNDVLTEISPLEAKWDKQKSI